MAKHRVFAWLTHPIVPDKNLTVIARADDTTFGILHSRFHELWSLRLGTSLEDRPRYTPTTFETFHFPAGLTPDLAPSACANPAADAIAEAARRLVELRDHWLNPAEWTERRLEVCSPLPPGEGPGVRDRGSKEGAPRAYPDRILPKPGFEAELKKRTLTNLYNARPAWLAHAHQALDAAVAQACGWTDYTPETVDDDILRRLLALNLKRAAGQEVVQS